MADTVAPSVEWIIRVAAKYCRYSGAPCWVYNTQCRQVLPTKSRLLWMIDTRWCQVLPIQWLRLLNKRFMMPPSVYTVSMKLKRDYPSRQYVRTSVRSSFTKCTLVYREQTAGLKASICANMDVDKVRSKCWFLSESSTCLTLISKVKGSNWVHWEVHTWLSRKRWQIRQRLLFPTQEVACDLSTGIFTFDFGPKGNVKVMHITTVKIWQTVT